MRIKVFIAHWEFLDLTIQRDEILIILTCLAFMLLVLMEYFRFPGWPKVLGPKETNADVLSAWMNRFKRRSTPAPPVPAPAPAPAPKASSPLKKPHITEKNRRDVRDWASTMLTTGDTSQVSFDTWMANKKAAAKKPNESNKRDFKNFDWRKHFKDYDLDFHASTASDTSFDSVKAPKIKRCWANTLSVCPQNGSEASSPRGRSPVRELGAGRHERASRSWGFKGFAEFDKSEWAGL